VVGELIGMMLKRALKGEDPTKMPLPVRIFEHRSLLQRLSRWFTQAPAHLRGRGDAVHSFKAVLAFAVSTLFHTVTQKKPFNPTLGETYQA